jgi:hypothetical protein
MPGILLPAFLYEGISSGYGLGFGFREVEEGPRISFCPHPASKVGETQILRSVNEKIEILARKMGQTLKIS